MSVRRRKWMDQWLHRINGLGITLLINGEWLGSMGFHLLINGLCILRGNNPLILSIDPNFLGHPSTRVSMLHGS